MSFEKVTNKFMSQHFVLLSTAMVLTWELLQNSIYKPQFTSFILDNLRGNNLNVDLIHYFEFELLDSTRLWP